MQRQCKQLCIVVDADGGGGPCRLPGNSFSRCGVRAVTATVTQHLSLTVHVARLGFVCVCVERERDRDSVYVCVCREREQPLFVVLASACMLSVLVCFCTLCIAHGIRVSVNMNLVGR